MSNLTYIGLVSFSNEFIFFFPVLPLALKSLFWDYYNFGSFSFVVDPSSSANDSKILMYQKLEVS